MCFSTVLVYPIACSLWTHLRAKVNADLHSEKYEKGTPEIGIDKHKVSLFLNFRIKRIHSINYKC